MLNRLNVCRTAILCWWIMVAQSVNAAADTWQLNMPRGVTPLSKDIYNLHMVAIGVCAVIGALVFGVMIYSLIFHRHSKGYQPAAFHDNLRVEVIWTIVPFLILIALAVPATRVLMHLEDTRHADVTIKVVGSQWRWQYQYLDQGISFYSNLSTPYAQIQNEAPKGEWYLLEVDNPVVVPVNRKIRFLVTSTDVIHSWWVPELGVKRDAIPGFMHEAWALIDTPGTYRGQCAELCGINHGYMPIVVEAVSEEAFDKWVEAKLKSEEAVKAASKVPAKQKKMSRAELMRLGKIKYEVACGACHMLNGKGIPPLYPALKDSSVAVGYPIDRHINMILTGIPGSAMQSFKDLLSDKDIAAIVTYERNAWGNNTDDVIQPSDVAAARLSLYGTPDVVVKSPSQQKVAQVGGLQ